MTTQKKKKTKHEYVWAWLLGEPKTLSKEINLILLAPHWLAQLGILKRLYHNAPRVPCMHCHSHISAISHRVTEKWKGKHQPIEVQMQLCTVCENGWLTLLTVLKIQNQQNIFKYAHQKWFLLLLQNFLTRQLKNREAQRGWGSCLLLHEAGWPPCH